jgi:hypothetical protein
MPDVPPRSPLPAQIELLEAREVPTASASLVEPFQRGPAQGLPTGWVQWSSDNSNGFQVDQGPGLGDQGRLVSSERSGVTNRAWVNTPFAANVETSAAVFLNSTNAIQLFVRGRNLNAANATYYAVSVTRGAEIQLQRVLNGQTTTLGSVKSTDYLSNRWVTISIRADGDRLRVSLHRGDTNQFLGADGKWTRRPVAAIERVDRMITGAGQVGFGRPPGPASDVIVDSLRVNPASTIQSVPIVEERFSQGTNNGLPPGWLQWQQGGTTYTTGTDETVRIDAGSNATARAWSNKPIASDSQISSSIYVDSLIPAGIFARGTNVDTPTASFYSLTITRGLEVKLNRVIEGQSATLATLKSREWLSGLWVQASMVLNGNQIRVQVYRSDTGQYLNSDGYWALDPVWALTRTDNSIRSGSTVGLSRGAGYAGQLIFDNFIVTTAPDRNGGPGRIPTEGDKPSVPGTPGEDLPGPVSPPPVTPPVPPPPLPPTPNSALPTVARNYSHIRLANLAYWGTPFGSFEQSLIRNSVDLVIPNLAYLDDIEAINNKTPQFVYTNVSNIYLGLINDWNDYADKNRISREDAFYHVNRSTTYNGMSASAVPVNRFWGVFRSATNNTWTNLTRDARNTGNDFTMADAGQSVALGYIEKFREINWDLKTFAAAGWTGRLEYVSAVDSAGRPTRWSTLNLQTDSTNGFRRDGQMTFDPPRDWVASSIDGSARLFFVRVRSMTAGTAPSVTTVLGRDFTVGNKIPAFDKSADRDGDGYLNNEEYARRKSGFDARFVYESRLFYPNYGPMRYATNVSNPGFRNWAVDYHARFLASQPLADGFFVDNSIGRLIVDPTGVTETLEPYSNDYGSLLGNINKRLMRDGKWLIANTAGGNTTAEPILRNGVSYLEEFALRPLTANHVQFDDLAATLAYRRQLSGGKTYEILDSLPQGLDANDPRMQSATLAMYYLLADPNTSFLMLNGGNEPNSSWTRHWFDSLTFNVGRPLGTSSLFATGNDPSNASLVYKVYQREYANALVLYKPLSYTRGVNGKTTDNTATLHRLDGWYRVLRSDGSLGTPVRQISLRNGEGVVLVKSR